MKTESGPVTAPSRQPIRWWRSLLPIIFIAFLTGGTAYPFVHSSSVSSADSQTRRLHWSNLPVDFVVDDGTLAGGDGVPLVGQALDTWDDVPYARRLGGQLYSYGLDFNAGNLGTDYGIIGDDINEIVFDETGEVLEILGLDPAVVAGVSLTVEDTATQEIVDSLLVLNGTFASGPDLDMEATIVHELGHIWGLGHTFVGAVNTANTEPGSFPIDAAAIPTMYPYSNPVDDTYGRTLEWDDWAGISALYPETVDDPPAQIPFGAETGKLRGRVYYKGRIPLTGVHVRAVEAGSEDVQVSCLSGFAGDGTGTFEIPGLPPGSYYLVAEGIDGRDGVVAADIEDDGIGACVLDGFAEIRTALPSGVGAGGTVSGFRFDIPELPLANDDVVEFGLPDGFTFHFIGVPCRRVFLHTNGQIGFHRYENPDPAVTVPGPDVHDFLSRPMARLCLLKCDLDPQGNAGGGVDVQTNPGQVTFAFNNVRINGSTASVTARAVLENTSNFRFEYGALPAVDALVGYTGGVFTTGGLEGSTDLTLFTGAPVPTQHAPVLFQILPAMDLANQTLYFPRPATDPFPVRNRLIYPWLRHDDSFTLGLAVVSNCATVSRLRITAYGTDGRPLPVAANTVNPVYVDLDPFAQFVTQIGQLFDFAGTGEGWVLVETDNPDPYGIQGFFLAQSFLGGVMDSLDGAVALADTDRTLLFSRYSGEAAEYTLVTVVNPGPFWNDVLLHVYYEDGREDQFQEPQVAPNGAAVFPLTGAGSAYMVADCTAPAAGFALYFNEAGSLAGQASQFLWEARDQLVSPHFVAQSGVFASRLDLVNPGNQLCHATVTLFNAAGAAVGHPVNATIAGWYNTRLDLSPAIFGFNAAALADGWIRVNADQPIVGAITFGDPDFADYQATLPLQYQPLYYALHSHLAQGTVGGIGYLTGLAALSLASGNRLTVDVYDSTGSKLYGVAETLGTGQRKIGLLDQWMPAGPWPRAGGYLTGEASKGIYAYEIFTTADSLFFAAVPAQKYLPVQYEENDADNGWPDSAELLAQFPVEVSGEIPAGDSGYFLIDLGDGFTDIVEDLFQFQVPRAGRYIFSLYPDNRYCDLDLYLFDQDWNIIEQAASGVPGAEFVEFDLEAGTAFLGVSRYDLGWFGTAGYHLLVEPDEVF